MAALLKVANLDKSYEIGSPGLFRRPRAQVLHDVSFSVAPGEVLGLVGESGSGKSTIGRCVLRLTEADSGTISFDALDLKKMRPRELRALRKDIQVIFQDPYASLDPRKTVRETLSEPLDTHGLHAGSRRQARLEELMSMVGLDLAFLDRYPHQFSGGQRQRIGIARALAVEPRLIVADEAVSALDVSIQAQVLNLLADLRERTGISMLFISHDLSVVRFISDRVMVLYLGRVMETGPADAIHFDPLHPYTKALVSAEPDLKGDRRHVRLSGDLPSPLKPPSGCVFRTRCPHAIDACKQEVPALRDMGNGRMAACIRDDIPG